ncbi:MAG: molybdenum cofactor biosysynthesis protein [Gemmatimonadales bacterium]|nr:MAG: molybdenum cofactor biosysynthesis protein [Gemmatimonadales bacterium]
MITIEHLFVSPGHNFFGHFGKPPGENPTIEVPQVECVAGRGIRGDRFFDHKEDYKGQITFFAMEIYEELLRTLDVGAGGVGREELGSVDPKSPESRTLEAESPGPRPAEPELPGPGVFRRNVLTRGVDLNTLIGKEFEIQGVRFEGAAECSPCFWMDRAFAPGAEDALEGRGGLRARILTDGVLRVPVRP